MENFLTNLPDVSNGEIFQTLTESREIRIERIISLGQATAEGEWYDQEQNEWVLLVAGEAELVFDDTFAPQRMKPGDYLMIPARKRHRVNWTAPDRETVWLAVHY